MRNTQSIVCLALGLSSLAGCTFYARGPADYRKATRELLETKSESIESCYKAELESTQDAKGKVVVNFEVEAKTGNLVKVEVVDENTDAGDKLQQCVVSALEGLKLAPPDQRTGQATFEWEFAQARF